eukprot:173046_1
MKNLVVYFLLIAVLLVSVTGQTASRCRRVRNQSRCNRLDGCKWSSKNQRCRRIGGEGGGPPTSGEGGGAPTSGREVLKYLKKGLEDPRDAPPKAKALMKQKTAGLHMTCNCLIAPWICVCSN